jgi:hypothetical protein
MGHTASYRCKVKEHFGTTYRLHLQELVSRLVSPTNSETAVDFEKNYTVYIQEDRILHNVFCKTLTSYTNSD